MSTPDNRRRAAELLLACLDDQPAKITAILDQAHADPSGLQGLLSEMTSAVLEILIATAGEDGARQTLSLVLLDLS
jgi:hypothetical protein